MRLLILAAAMALALARSAGALELRGKVIGVSGGTEVQIEIEGESAPAVGDAVTVFFKLPGFDDEVLVGTGKVTSVTEKTVKATIDDLKGRLQKDQLARIESVKPQLKSSTTPSMTPAPSPSRAPVYTPPPDYVPKLGTAASYNCDDGAGDVLTDNSNNGRSMKLYGGLKFGPGKSGKALDFRDSTKLFAKREKDDTIFNFDDRDFLIELFVNFRAFHHEQVLLEKFTGGGGPGWTFTLLDKSKLHFFTKGAGVFTAPVNLKPGRWYRLAVERREARLRVFVDDAVVLDQPMSGAIAASPNPLLLGCRNPEDGRAFSVNGLIDNVRIDVVPPRRE